jgi:hypothetical protein
LESTLTATIVKVALPTLSRELDADNAQLQWIVDAYTWCCRGCCCRRASFADRYGRRGWLIAGDHSDELWPMGGQCARRFRRGAPLGERAGQGEHKHDWQESAEYHRQPEGVLYQSVLPLSPANADPLLSAAEVNAYKTSDSPCGPLLSMPARSPGSAIAVAVPIGAISGVTRK